MGVHQRLDSAAYRMILPFLPPDRFPSIRQILRFEGYHGPDGLKVKSPGRAEPSHLYDPTTDRGEVPMHIANHYRELVQALVASDEVRAAFEAAWLAHFVCDGMTPAHHFPLEDQVALLRGTDQPATNPAGKILAKTADDTTLKVMRKGWKIWGPKGLLSTHHNFEIGTAFALIRFTTPGELDEQLVVRARRVGPVEFFKMEARDIAQLKLYDRFYAEGWNADIAGLVKKVIAPKTAAAIGVIWLLAILEAEQQLAVEYAAHLER